MDRQHFFQWPYTILHSHKLDIQPHLSRRLFYNLFSNSFSLRLRSYCLIGAHKQHMGDARRTRIAYAKEIAVYLLIICFNEFLRRLHAQNRMETHLFPLFHVFLPIEIVHSYNETQHTTLHLSTFKAIQRVCKSLIS